MASDIKVEVRTTKSAVEKSQSSTTGHAIHRRHGNLSASAVKTTSGGRSKSASVGLRCLQDQSTDP
jgi:hypothetical protein